MSIDKTYYSTSYYIERDRQKNTYALFFITPNRLGYEKILEAKWELDTDSGKGFKIDTKNTDLFNNQYVNDYEIKLEKFIKSGVKTNIDLFNFGLDNEQIPKNTNKVLKKWKTLERLEVFDIQSNKPKKGFFISNRELKVWFKLK